MARSRRAFFLRLVDTPVAMLWYDNSRQILGFLHNGDLLILPCEMMVVTGLSDTCDVV